MSEEQISDRDIDERMEKLKLMEKALEERESVPEEVLASLEGPTSIFFSDVANAPAKVIKGFRKGGGELPILKVACLMTDAFVGDDKVDTLSKLKTKTELIGEVIGLLQSPMANVIGALQSGGDTIGGIVKTLQEREQ